MRLVILDWATMTAHEDLSPECFRPFADEIDCYSLTSPGEAAARIGDAELVLCNKVPITGEVIEACPNLKYIGLFATGYNNVDIPAATARGIRVCNAGSYSTNAVAQLVFAFMLDHFSKLPLYNLDVRQGKWCSSPTFSYFPYPTMELAGKTLSVIGFGSIGKAVAKIADAFGMQVLVSTRTVPAHAPYPMVTLAEAFARADVLTLHCPLTEDTRQLVNAIRLGSMKPSAILINTARGGVVAEHDLAEALNNDVIAGAYLDVLQQEPMNPDTPLRHAKNCVITPHIAWAPLETRQRLLGIVTDNLQHFLAGNPQNLVN